MRNSKTAKMTTRRTEPQSARRLIASPALWIRASDAPWLGVVGGIVPFALLIVVVLFWATSLTSVNLRSMNDPGLISALPPGFFIATALLTCAFCLSLRNQPVHSSMPLLHVGMLILVLFGTPALVEATPGISVVPRGSLFPAPGISVPWQFQGYTTYQTRWIDRGASYTGTSSEMSRLNSCRSSIALASLRASSLGGNRRGICG
jgi:hypothetical protein